ncbi:putative plant self-incompatibility S1 [Medicago truncatula]|uniref:S-protein homolog n=1 Tax=Medicago truncatula TaxID=3880 RepID=A0A072UXY5_MEDTR|nr:leguminosin group486 secreted peptide [Medicago truncatula]RHN67815.1 putative plant self-incompatibility S1 [Medicago truncatula]
MAASNPIILKFSILLVILLIIEVRAIDPTVTVTIINKVVELPNPQSLIVHCKSKDNDLGNHVLRVGESYSFSFRPVIFPITKNTLFYCSFSWPLKPRLHYLDVYDESNAKCTDCTWKINIDGGCLNNYPCVHWKSVELMDAYNTSKWPETRGFVERGDAQPPTL